VYSAKTASELVYRDVFDQAVTQFGAKVYYLTGDKSPKPPIYNARIDADSLKRIGIDNQALYYISGPHSMVASAKEALRSSGVPLAHIKTDFFSGY
jgi:ferredoxin-NADP reductase